MDATIPLQAPQTHPQRIGRKVGTRSAPMLLSILFLLTTLASFTPVPFPAQ